MKQPTTLDEFLAPLSTALGNDSVPASVEPFDLAAHMPAHVTNGLSHAELIERFVSEAGKIHVHMHRCTAQGVASKVAGIIMEQGGDKVMAASSDKWAAYGLNTELSKIEGLACSTWDTHTSDDINFDKAQEADFGITFADSAIAETGTIVQSCSPSCGRAISLLPLTHIAIIEASTIVSSMYDVLKGLEASGGTHALDLSSQICFISGPSNTSDIELVRVGGVHGPMYVHYVLVDS